VGLAVIDDFLHVFSFRSPICEPFAGEASELRELTMFLGSIAGSINIISLGHFILLSEPD
jgi:hypothetical protein